MCMKKVIAGSIIFFLMLLQGCDKGPPADSTAPTVAATIFPLQDIATNIAGDRLEVAAILRPGASPHTYTLAPRQVREFRNVKVVFSIGGGLDDWVDALIETLPDAKKVVVDRGIHWKQSGLAGVRVDEHKHAGGDSHNHKEANPHYWLSISNGKIIAATIAEELIRLNPEDEDYYSANLKEYLSQLDVLRIKIAEKIDRLPNKKMLTFHDAWIYYAEEFGLEIVGAFEPFPGKQPTPRYLADLQEKVKRHKVTALFSEPQLSNETIAPFVADMGLKLAVLDPLGGIEGRNSYIELLTYNTDVIVETLSNE